MFRALGRVPQQSSTPNKSRPRSKSGSLVAYWNDDNNDDNNNNNNNKYNFISRDNIFGMYTSLTYGPQLQR